MVESKQRSKTMTPAEKKAAANMKRAELESVREPKYKETILTLSVKDRIVVNGILPKEGNMLTQILIRDIIEKIRISQEEITDIEFVVVGNGYKWNEEKASDIEVGFTNAEFKILSDAVSDLDKKNKVTQDLLDLCMKITKVE